MINNDKNNSENFYLNDKSVLDIIFKDELNVNLGKN